MSEKIPDEPLTDEEAARRRDEALRQMLRTPPKPRPKPLGEPKQKGG